MATTAGSDVVTLVKGDTSILTPGMRISGKIVDNALIPNGYVVAAIIDNNPVVFLEH